MRRPAAAPSTAVFFAEAGFTSEPRGYSLGPGVSPAGSELGPMFDFLRLRFDPGRRNARQSADARAASAPPLAEGEVFKRRGLGPLGARGAGARLFDPGSLRLLMLALIGESPRFGYDIVKALRERTRGAYAPSPGSVYPNMRLLERGGLVVAESVGKRSRFLITEAGRACLRQSRVQLDEIEARLTATAAPLDREPLGETLNELGDALSRKFRMGQIDDERAERVHRILKRALAAIERA